MPTWLPLVGCVLFVLLLQIPALPDGMEAQTRYLYAAIAVLGLTVCIGWLWLQPYRRPPELQLKHFGTIDDPDRRWRHTFKLVLTIAFAFLAWWQLARLFQEIAIDRVYDGLIAQGLDPLDAFFEAGRPTTDDRVFQNLSIACFIASASLGSLRRRQVEISGEPGFEDPFARNWKR